MDPFYVVLGLVIFFLLLPARWDPAIRIKEWTEGWHDKPKKPPPGTTYGRHNNWGNNGMPFHGREDAGIIEQRKRRKDKR